jgi:CubicO group peptidase (beta-lactamase class C family)
MQMRAFFLGLAFSMLVLARPAGAVQSARDRALAEFQARIEEDVLADGVGSIAAGVIVGTDLVWSHGIGLKDRERELDADAETLYRIGSISKSITAATMMALAQRGVLALDDPVVKHLPEFAGLGAGVPEARTITLRQLASHTAGLVREPALEDAAEGPLAQWEEKVLASIPKTTLRGKPGAEYSYSNIGYGILGLAISRAAHEPFMDLVRKLVFEPAGMTSSTFVVAPPLAARLAVGYSNDREGNVDASQAAREHAGRGYKVPNGGVYSTVADLGRFMALMSGALEDGVLSAASRAEMLTRQTPAGGEAYALGFALGTDAYGNHFVSHGGAVSGYTALIVFHPESRTGVVLLRNYESGRTDLQKAAEALLSALVTPGK